MAKSPRPRYLTVICVLSLIWGCGNAMKSFRDLLENQQTVVELDAMMAANGVVTPEHMTAQVRWIIYMNAAIIVVSVASLVGAAFLLWLRGWSRALLEASCWGWVLVIASFAWKAMAIETVAQAIANGNPFRDPLDATIMDLSSEGLFNVLVVGAKLMLTSIPFLYIVKKLRQRETYEAVYSERMREITGEESAA